MLRVMLAPTAFVIALALGAAEPRAEETFPVATVHFEQNATDGDIEVVFEVQAEDEGLAELTVTAQDGRRVVAFQAPESSTLGIRQFRLESPEPRNLASLKAAYPEGVYAFAGRTFSGARFVGRSRLDHQLPPTATILAPRPEADGVPVHGVEISWRAVPSVGAYIVELENDELGTSITARLPGTATSFAVPDGFLVSGQEYDFQVGAVAANGNVSFVERSFTTGR